MFQRYIEKLKVLFRVLKMVYTLRPLHAIVRDIAFLVSVALEMYTIKLGGQFIDATSKILSDWRSFNVVEYFYSDSFYYLILSLGFWMIVTSLGRLRDYLKEDIKNYILFHMQGRLLDVISRTNLEDIETKSFRDLLTFVPNFSYWSVINSYEQFSDATSSLLKMSSAIAILYSYVGFSAFLLPLLALPENLIGHMQRKNLKKFDDKEVETLKTVDYLQTVMTRLQYFPELRVDNTFFSLKNKYSKNAMKYLIGYLKRTEHFYIDTTLFAILDRLVMTIYIVYSLSLSLILKYSIGTFKAIYDYAITSYDGAYSFISSLFLISNQIEYSKKYFEYEEFKGFGDIDHGDKKLGSGVPSLELKSVKFRYPGSSHPSLKSISLTIQPGEKAAIVGSDGSGKSSLVKILCGLYRVIDGRYLIGGIDVKELDRGELKKKMSVMFQDYVNYNLTLKENITLTSSASRIDEELYKRVSDIIDLDLLIKTEKIDENQILGKYFSKGQEISLGYWQRLAIARMLYRNRGIILMDEPFTYIDEVARRKIIKKIMKFAKNRTVIFITQDYTNNACFDKVYSLKEGKLILKKGKK